MHRMCETIIKSIAGSKALFFCGFGIFRPYPEIFVKTGISCFAFYFGSLYKLFNQ